MENSFNEEQKQVFEVIERMVYAFHTKDIHGVLACYEDRATVMFEPQQPLSGTEMLRTAFLQAFTMNPQYDLHKHEIYVTGDIATHIAPWAMKGRLPDGTDIEQNGLSIAVLRKQPSGGWLIAQDNPHGQFLLDN